MPQKLEDCVKKVKAQGKDESSAYAICNDSLYGSSVEITEQDDKLFLRAFLLDSSVNLNEWGVSKETLDQNIQTYIGKPLVIQEDFNHPDSGDPNYDHHLQYQEQFRIGNINAIAEKDGKYSAIIEVTDPSAKQAFRNGDLPLYVSPQIFHDGVREESDTDAKTWRGTHLAIVREPAFGVKKARIEGQCSGSKQTCIAQLKKASCSFCIKKTIKNYKVSKNKNVVNSSLENKNHILSSKLENDKVSQETKQEVSIEEHTKLQEQLKQANEEIKSLKSLTNEKDTVISQLKQGNEDLTNRVGTIEKEIRTKEIANVLSAVTFKTDEERSKRLETLVNSNLAIDAIRETYEPLISAQSTKSASISTKLPQKSASSEEQNEVPAWVTIARLVGGNN